MVFLVILFLGSRYELFIFMNDIFKLIGSKLVKYEEIFFDKFI